MKRKWIPMTRLVDAELAEKAKAEAVPQNGVTKNGVWLPEDSKVLENIRRQQAGCQGCGDAPLDGF